MKDRIRIENLARESGLFDTGGSISYDKYKKFIPHGNKFAHELIEFVTGIPAKSMKVSRKKSGEYQPGKFESFELLKSSYKKDRDLIAETEADFTMMNPKDGGYWYYAVIFPKIHTKIDCFQDGSISLWITNAYLADTDLFKGIIDWVSLYFLDHYVEGY